jgi:hypothetical protein
MKPLTKIVHRRTLRRGRFQRLMANPRGVDLAVVKFCGESICRLVKPEELLSIPDRRQVTDREIELAIALNLSIHQVKTA